MIEKIEKIEFINFIGHNGDPSYDPNAEALFARFTTPPTDDRKLIINDLIVSIQPIWAKIIALYLMAAADAQAARRNWKADLFNLTAFSSPTFAIDRGYTGDNAAAYLGTGLNPTIVGGYSQNSASAGVYSRTAAALDNISKADLGSASGGFIRISPRVTGDLTVFRLNRAVNFTVASDSGIGFFHSSRVAAGGFKGYKNGVEIADASAAPSTGIPNDNITLLREATLYSNHQIAASFIATGLTPQEGLLLSNSIITYLQAVGA